MKKNKKFVHIVAMILAVLMVLSLLVSFVPVYASAQVTQADIDAVRSERNKSPPRWMSARSVLSF